MKASSVLACILTLALAAPAWAAEEDDPDYEEFKQFQEYKKLKKQRGSKENEEFQKFKRSKEAHQEKTAPAAGEPAPKARSGGRELRLADLTPEEREIYRRGEISTGAYVAGGVTGTLLGLGIGHAVQGRYSDKGWIFTVGEIASLAFYGIGAVDCFDEALDHWATGSSRYNCNESLAVLGAVGLLGFRLWELIDVWAGPPTHNDRYRRIREDVEGRSFSFFLAPTGPTDLLAGIRLRF